MLWFAAMGASSSFYYSFVMYTETVLATHQFRHFGYSDIFEVSCLYDAMQLFCNLLVDTHMCIYV